ncbi:MAG: hypothetical protein KAU17_12670 [Spirochaetales bacterium]|nr:hypothetical protein [Spirochaetales bacterium]
MTHVLPIASGKGGVKAEETLSSFYPQIILNMGRSRVDLSLGTGIITYI